MTSVLKILYSDMPSQCDSAFSKLADFLGIDSTFIPANEYIAGKDHEKSGKVLTLSCDALAGIYESSDKSDSTISQLTDNNPFLFIYGISPGSTNVSALKDITGGVVKDIISHSSDGNQYEVSGNNPEITKHFSGLSFGMVNKETDFGLTISDSADNIEKLITVDNKPLFLKINKGHCCIFLLATNRIIDIDRPASGIPDISTYFSGLVPILMSLKHVFKDRCWHSDSEYASLIIDDPPLKERYGFLDYDLLIKEMDRHHFHSTIAFIPWNYRRTSKKTASMFRVNSDRLSICVHGCDHTKSEFGRIDPSEIDKKTKLPLLRMLSHEKLTGISFDKIMVFPQGVFSTTSLMVLKSNNYLAAVNSVVTPSNANGPVSIRDVLRPAVMSYYGFPLYYRRYPRTIGAFALDLFLGKPALIVTHHNDYKDIDAIIRFIDGLNSISPKLKWTGLGNIANNSYLIRRTGKDVGQVRLYSPVVILNNASDGNITYNISKQEAPEINVKRATINGQDSSYYYIGDDLHLDIEVAPKSNNKVEIIYDELYPDTRVNVGMIKNIHVALRRFLSEFRDNYVDKSSLLSSVNDKLKKFI
jgi:hypothetical protein